MDEPPDSPTRLEGKTLSGVDSVRVTGLVSLAHLYSHFFFFVLPPLFPLLREDLSVTYTELGLLIVVFNIVSALTQLPMGMIVDRLDAPKLLTAAVALQGVSLILMGVSSLILGAFSDDDTMWTSQCRLSSC